MGKRSLIAYDHCTHKEWEWKWEEYPMNSSQHVSSVERGIELLRDPQRNKSTAYTEAEREALGLTGLLPSGVEDEETQVRPALQQLGEKPTDLERYIYLIGLLDTGREILWLGHLGKK